MGHQRKKTSEQVLQHKKRPVTSSIDFHNNVHKKGLSSKTNDGQFLRIFDNPLSKYLIFLSYLNGIAVFWAIPQN